jgi:hypothetical protein
MSSAVKTRSTSTPLSKCGMRKELSTSFIGSLVSNQAIIKNVIFFITMILDTEGTNSVSTTHIIESISNLTSTRPKTGFDKSSLEKLEQLFKKTVGEGQEIKRDDFKKIVISKNVRF